MHLGMPPTDRSSLTADEVRAGTLATLDRAWRRAKELDSYGPEYGSEGARAAYAMAWQIALANEPVPGEDAETWVRRVDAMLTEEFSKLAAILGPELAEARRPSWANAHSMMGAMPWWEEQNRGSSGG